MENVTFSLAQFEPRPPFIDTARDTVRAIKNMSAQTKARLEFLALILGLLITVASAVKAFVFLPPRVDAHDLAIQEVQADLKMMQAKAAATDVTIAGIAPQLAAMNQGLLRIESDVREIRRANGN